MTRRKTATTASDALRRLRKAAPFFWFSGPALVLYLCFFVYPVAATFRLSLYNWDGFSPVQKFVGFQNFSWILADAKFWAALQNNVLYTVLVFAIQNTLALALAVLLNGSLRGTTFYRSVFFMPVTLSMVAIGYLWELMYNPFFGLIDVALRKLGLASFAMPWLADQRTAMLAVAVVQSWQYAGFAMVILLAGLQTIPKELYEQARIDGAGGWKVFARITWPLLAPSVTVVTTLTVIGCMRVFDIIYVMTEGGPANKTLVMSLLMFREAFTNYRLGYGSAVSVIQFLIILLLSVTLLRYLRSREVQY